MGVESTYFIMPSSSGFRPEPNAIISMIRNLQEMRYLDESPKWSVGTAKSSGCFDDLCAVLDANRSSDIMVRWQIPNFSKSGLRYPLTMMLGPDVYYSIEIHLVGDTAYGTSEIVHPFESIQCACGMEIEESPSPDTDRFYMARLPSICPACGESVDYAQIPMFTSHPFTGEEESCHGGITYRCAIIIDCGKCYPDYEAKVDPGFIAEIELVFGDELRVIQDFSC